MNGVPLFPNFCVPANACDRNAVPTARDKHPVPAACVEHPALAAHAEHPAVPTASFKDTKTLEDKIIKLEKANNALQVVYEESVLDAEDAHKNISTLEKQLEIMRTKLEDKKDEI